MKLIFFNRSQFDIYTNTRIVHYYIIGCWFYYKMYSVKYLLLWLCLYTAPVVIGMCSVIEFEIYMDYKIIYAHRAESQKQSHFVEIQFETGFNFWNLLHFFKTDIYLYTKHHWDNICNHNKNNLFALKTKSKHFYINKFRFKK